MISVAFLIIDSSALQRRPPYLENIRTDEDLAMYSRTLYVLSYSPCTLLVLSYSRLCVCASYLYIYLYIYIFIYL